MKRTIGLIVLLLLLPITALMADCMTTAFVSCECGDVHLLLQVCHQSRRSRDHRLLPERRLAGERDTVIVSLIDEGTNGRLEINDREITHQAVLKDGVELSGRGRWLVTEEDGSGSENQVIYTIKIQKVKGKLRCGIGITNGTGQTVCQCAGELKGQYRFKPNRGMK